MDDSSNIVTFRMRETLEEGESGDNVASGGDTGSTNNLEETMKNSLRKLSEEFRESMSALHSNLTRHIGKVEREVRYLKEVDDGREVTPERYLERDHHSDQMQDFERNLNVLGSECERDENSEGAINREPRRRIPQRVNFREEISEPEMFPLHSSPHPEAMRGPRHYDGMQQSKIKPQTYNGKEDFDEYLTQFNIIAELHNWNYRTKSLYLASCLVGDARALLNELTEEKRRDYESLVEALDIRFGSINRAEVFRSKLQSRIKSKDETIPELAQSIKKLTRKAYPGATNAMINVLSLDYFIDALPDSDVRLRLREVGPKTITEAESIAVRLEAHRIADKNRGRQPVKSVEFEQRNQDDKVSENLQMAEINQNLNSLTEEVKNLQKQQSQNNRQANYGNNQQNGYRPRNGRNFQSRDNWYNGNQRGNWYNGNQRGNNQNYGQRNNGHYQANQDRGQGQRNNAGHANNNNHRQMQENDQRSNLGTAGRQHHQ